MSISQKITDLALYVPEEKYPELEELANILLKYSPEYQVDALKAALASDDYDSDMVHTLIDDLQTATAQHKRPEIVRYNSFKTDLKRYFELSHAFLDIGKTERIINFLERYNNIFGEPKRYCGRILTRCSESDCDGKFTSLDQYLCIECGAPRDLCRRAPTDNGRCSTHQGYMITGPLNNIFKTPGRARIYGQNLQGELQQMYIEAVTDPDFLSVAPEIAALAARSGELMRDIGDTDYLLVSAKMRQAIRAMRNAANEDDASGMLRAAGDIEEQLTAVADDKRRWDEIAAISGRLGRLTETERKRIIEAQKVITVQEMYTLQQETLMQIRDAFAIVADSVVKWVGRGKPIEQPKLRQYMLTTLHKIMSGDVNLDKSLKNDEPLVIDGEVESAI